MNELNGLSQGMSYGRIQIVIQVIFCFTYIKHFILENNQSKSISGYLL